MGQKSSALTVTSQLRLHCDCGGVDSIELSYPRSGCCWGKRKRRIASFTFPSKDNDSKGPRNSAQVASVHVGRLAKKDGDTPVTVRCLAGGVTVFTEEMALSHLLTGLQYTTTGRQAVLYFSLAGGKIQVQEDAPQGHKQVFTALFCNGRRLGEGGAKPLTTTQPPPLHHHATNGDGDGGNVNGLMKKVSPGHVADPEQVSPGKEQVSPGYEADPEQVSPGHEADLRSLATPSRQEDGQALEEDVIEDIPFGDEEDVMERIPSGGVMEGVEEGACSPPIHQHNPHTLRKKYKKGFKGGSQGHVVSRHLWDHVAQCAQVIGLTLVVYNAYLEYYYQYW